MYLNFKFTAMHSSKHARAAPKSCPQEFLSFGFWLFPVCLYSTRSGPDFNICNFDLYQLHGWLLGISLHVWNYRWKNTGGE